MRPEGWGLPPAALCHGGSGLVERSRAADGAAQRQRRLGLGLLEEHVLDGQEQRQAQGDHLLQVHAARDTHTQGSEQSQR